MRKFKGKYRIQSNRADFWDYSSNGRYFITIVTKNREHFFGKIQDNKMILSEIGELAQKYWYEIPEHFPFVILHAFVVMPNHIHGIIEIAKNDEFDYVETQNLASLLHPSPELTMSHNEFGPQSRNLPSIIRGYKIGVTKNAKKINPDWGWQSRYHDHIIRNDKSYQKITKYIHNNPFKWNNDKYRF